MHVCICIEVQICAVLMVFCARITLTRSCILFFWCTLVYVILPSILPLSLSHTPPRRACSVAVLEGEELADLFANLFGEPAATLENK